MKTSVLVACTVAMLAGTSAANALTMNFSSGGGDGFGSQSVDAGDAFTVSMTGNNNGASGIYTTFSNLAAGDTTVAFGYNYSTADVDGPSFDPFGYFVDGVYTQVSNSGGANAQSGSGSFFVASGSTWGFYVFSDDGGFGAASVNVNGTADFAPVPLPAAGLLLGSMLLGGAAMSHRRKAAA